jgi:uncharacterized protein YndB with AHSA1/START domain
MEHGIEDVIERSIVISAPLDRVWALVSTPGWWINDGTALRAGGTERIDDDTVVVHDDEHGDFRVTRLAADPPVSITFAWAVTPGIDTTVEFTLAERDDRTVLTVVERGFATAPVDDAARRTAIEDNTEGWRMELDLARAVLGSA